MKILLALLICLSAHAQELSETQYSFVRIFKAAEKHANWANSSVDEKILLIRGIAEKQKVVSTPVSDRYTITAYGGPIDLVHFLMLASEALKGKVNIYERLFQEWVAEGGQDHSYGFNAQRPSEAHPDDLPSNALGALWGQELNAKLKKGKVNLLEEFTSFVRPLKPLPDSIASQFSHKECVMGLEEHASAEVEISRYTWFSATPLNLTEMYNKTSKKLFNKEFCKVFQSGEECLNEAGFKLMRYRNRTIVILRK